ncbi:MAG: ABC transporter substrate-binding protein [Dongiaceae bacterium]
MPTERPAALRTAGPAAGARRAGGRGRRKLTYGAPTEKCATLVRLGIAEGVFAALGIDLEVEVVFSGPELARAYGEGRIPIGEMGSPPSVTAIARGAGFRLIGGGARRKLLTWLVTRPGIGSIEDLRGKRFGTLSPGSCGDWFYRQMLKARGLDSATDIQIVGIGPDYPRQVEMIVAGEIDATLLVEPAVAVAEAEPGVTVHGAVFEEPTFGTFQWCILAANDDFARREPDTVRAVLEGYRAAVRLAVADPELWRHFLVRHFGVSDEIAGRAVARELPMMAVDASIDIEGLANSIALQRRLGAITREIATADVVNPAFASLLGGAAQGAAR